MNWQTHSLSNQVDELRDYALFDTDPALVEGVQRAGAGWHAPQLSDYGLLLGKSETYQLAEQANRYVPELKTFDARGRRIDQVDFHPAWHQLLAIYRAQGLVSLSFEEPARAGRWTAFAAGMYLHGQIEAGTLCPATMTQASIPVLQKEPALYAALRDKLHSRRYDARDLPVAHKHSIWLGMGMTEKQGGSDVRSNTTEATPLGAGGRGGEYLLRGHKWFFSAPMCDAHLVVARSPSGHSCFYVPRWRPDDSKNPVQIQRLKNKLGNKSNSSSEVEFLDAWGLMLGEEGRGIPTIIEMAGYTRLNCVIGSAAIMRQALMQALHWARRRVVFGKPLAQQPLMRVVLADLALESEAATAVMLRLAEAFERDDGMTAGPLERAWKRIMTPAAKFWVCKRAVELTGEAMEVLGGNGYVEEGTLARLYREAPVNSIWEGSGNVMCLDVLRAATREPEALQVLFDDWQQRAHGEPRLLAALQALRQDLTLPVEQLEASGRRFTQGLLLLGQALLLRQTSPQPVAEAFIASRFEPGGGRVYGCGVLGQAALDAVLQRACGGLS
ncbi:isovaleryl-CoA dehydrogenase [Roseateles oligotrophus]|uniref:Isovaleryl-CoA dehydrogenase n=1 Tax=Roseateles oligotrophus TaxID=1769250 RepID=A0ABT2YKA9_9BURK|nr:isovaleryl-CoA dehydrogenase [Roseateles oligotrophus]MCV2370489.1 isovaleryl-CoA dehydrogenase [Roseateles oligotrophus]